MKQHISVEMLQELTDEQKERLREWWKPQEFDVLYWQDGERFAVAAVDETSDNGEYIYFGDMGPRKADCLPLLSIGQMIELLGRKIYFIMPEFNCKWLVRIFAGETSSDVLFKDIMAGDLTDALWQAVKEVL